MKQFNLEKYLRLKEEGKEPKIVTRDGRSVRILCTDRKKENGEEIIGLIPGRGGSELLASWNIPDGNFFPKRGSNKDLFFAPTKHEGWTNLYESSDGGHDMGCLYKTKDEAIRNIHGSKRHIATIKIEWEE